MKKLVIACTLFAFAQVATALERPGTPPKAPEAAKPAEAAKPPPAAGAPAAAPAADAHAGFQPRKVSKEDKKGIDAVYAAADDAMKKGDFDAWVATLHFPTFMVTDNAAGKVTAMSVEKAHFIEMMKPAMAAMPKDAKFTNKHKLEFLTDSLAIGIEDHTMTMGKTKMQWKSATLWVNEGGKWMGKSMIEGGWGDMEMKAPAPVAAPAVAKPAEGGNKPPAAAVPVKATGK